MITMRVTLCRDNFPISFAQYVSIFETKNSISANEVWAWAPGKLWQSQMYSTVLVSVVLGPQK